MYVLASSLQNFFQLSCFLDHHMEWPCPDVVWWGSGSHTRAVSCQCKEEILLLNSLWMTASQTLFRKLQRGMIFSGAGVKFHTICINLLGCLLQSNVGDLRLWKKGDWWTARKEQRTLSLGLRALLLQERTVNSSRVSGKYNKTPACSCFWRMNGSAQWVMPFFASAGFCSHLMAKELTDTFLQTMKALVTGARGCPCAGRPVRHQTNFRSRQAHGYLALHWAWDQLGLPQLFLQLLLLGFTVFVFCSTFQ